MNARSSIAAAVLAVMLGSRAAAADVSDVDRATARALTLEGYEALDRKDFATAADRFRRADALYHVPTVALGLAHAEVGLGKLVSALATYSRIVREGVPPGSPPAFTKAVDDARREIEALTQRVPTVIITVRGADQPQVTVDGVEVPAAALGVKRPVDPGAHVVRATAPGFLPAEVSLSMLEGKTESVTLDLHRDASAPPPPAAPPVAPPPAPPLPVVAAPVAPPAPPPAAPAEGGSTQRTLGFVGIGVGGAGLAIGAITGGLALAKHSDLIGKCPTGHCAASQQASLGSEVSAYDTLGTASTVGFVAGGALAATGVILVLTAPSRPAREAAFSPVLGPGYVGVTGRF
jgi:hypothetical protein